MGRTTFTGDGEQLYFDIVHGLTTPPSAFIVNAVSLDASGFWYAESINNGVEEVIRIYYQVAPLSAINGLVFDWTVN